MDKDLARNAASSSDESEKEDKEGKLTSLTDERSKAKGDDSSIYPPPEEIYRTKVKAKNDVVNFGLNMYFKQPHKFSSDPDQAGGKLAPNQTFSSQPWGCMGCPPQKQ